MIHLPKWLRLRLRARKLRSMRHLLHLNIQGEAKARSAEEMFRNRANNLSLEIIALDRAGAMLEQRGGCLVEMVRDHSPDCASSSWDSDEEHAGEFECHNAACQGRVHLSLSTLDAFINAAVGELQKSTR